MWVNPHYGTLCEGESFVPEEILSVSKLTIKDVGAGITMAALLCTIYSKIRFPQAADSLDSEWLSTNTLNGL